MIKVILGKKGSGKTKRMIDLANRSLSNRKGHVVFIDDDNRYMYELSCPIRFVDAAEFRIQSPEAFYGFLCGMLAQNYDIDLIFIDGFLKIINTSLDQIEFFFNDLDDLSQKFNVHFVISVSGDPENAPAFLSQYLLKGGEDGNS
ncbi:MAG: hypothetical protein ACOX6S_02355 [Clostridia bacterium]|jgi:hypothetical protein